MAGGGVIGGASAAGLALSPGMVGLLLLAAFGVYYIADNADAIGRSLEVVLEAEATNTELSLAAQAEYAAALTSWWESAKAGAIDLVSAPEWIADAIGLWAESFFNGSSVITSDEPGCGMVSVGDFVTHRFLLSNGAPSSSSFSFQVTDASAPVYYMTYCYGEYSHWTVLCSISDFSVVGGIKNPTFITRNGVKFWYTMQGIGNDSIGFSSDCVIVDGNYALEEVRMKCLSLVTSGVPSVTISPDSITGGIADEYENGIGMDLIGLPDIVIPGPDVLPVNPSEGQTTAQAVTDYLMAALIAGEITWEQYWQLIGVYNPAIGSSVPTVGTVDPVTGTITNTEISTGTVVTPSAIVDYQMDLKKFFPFCIPFDLYDFFTCLNADPVAPVIEWVIPLPGGGTYPLEIDLSAFDGVAQLLRRLQLLLFCVGLAFKTRDLIKG